MKQKRGMWIGVYFLAEGFALAVYLFGMALAMASGVDQPLRDPFWLGSYLVMLLIFILADVGYAMIYRMKVMYRGIKRRPLWMVLNVLFLITRACMLVYFLSAAFTGPAAEALAEFMNMVMAFVYNPSHALYFILLWYDIVIWLNESDRKKVKPEGSKQLRAANGR